LLLRNVSLFAAFVMGCGVQCQASSILYTNGPVNGQLNSFAINGGLATSNSFLLTGSADASGVTFVTWRDVNGDVISSVDWAITSTDFGGTTFGSGTASLAETFLFNNTVGVSIFSDTFSLPDLALPAGTYWLQLGNAVVKNSVGTVVNAPVFWDENNGPSAAFQQSGGVRITSNANADLPNTTGSETFSITGTFQSATPEPASGLLTLAGFAAAAIFGKRPQRNRRREIVRGSATTDSIQRNHETF
jgi:hypothetical protein